MTDQPNVDTFNELLAAAVNISIQWGHPRTEPFHLLQAITEDADADDMCTAIDFPYENLYKIVDANLEYYDPIEPQIEIDGEKFIMSPDFIDIKRRAIELTQEYNQSDVGYISIIKAVQEHGDKHSKFSLSELALGITDEDFDRFLKDEQVLQIPRAEKEAQKQKAFEKEMEQQVSKSTIKKSFYDAANDNGKILQMADTLKQRIIGQDKAVDTLAQTMKRAFAGLKEANKPVGSYLFAGPTGVGKTEIAQQLSDFLDIDLVRIDMSEYMEPHSVSRLIGSPPGYVGSDEEGIFMQTIGQNGKCVLLLDEIEKAHPQINNVLLQIMDNAAVTDTLGNTIDFSNVILIMTTNAGATDISKPSIGFVDNTANNQVANYNEAINKRFTPEFRNRLDKIVTFDHLEQSHLAEIAKIFVKELNKLPAAENRDLSFSANPRAIKAIVNKSYDQAMGARPIKRFMNETIKDMMADIILNKNVKNKKIVLCYSPENDSFHIEQKPLPKSHKSKKKPAAPETAAPEPGNM